MEGKKLSELLQGVEVKIVQGDAERRIVRLRFDSRAVEPGDAFVAVRGANLDGHRFIGQAVSRGAVSVIAEVSAEVPANVALVLVEDTSEALGLMASRYYDRPSQQLKLVGVTGTNGKTTCVTLLHSLFEALGYKAGMLSTVENKIGQRVVSATHTTPDALAINELLAEMVEEGCDVAFMEVSSHAAHQKRIAGLEFAGGAFTNITHDHLDYHKTFQAYIEAKKSFFDRLGPNAFALTNRDDRRGAVMLQNTAAKKRTYALRTVANFEAKLIDNSFEGLQIEIGGKQAWFRLNGEFNAYNLLCVYAIACLMGEEEEETLKTLSALPAARGRFEKVTSKDGVYGVIDYAHTPDALENVLETILAAKQPDARVIVVIGAGGDRDKTKRPEMARIAAEKADTVVLTSDNPRYEDPLDILADMQAGLRPDDFRKTRTEPNRQKAIRMAVEAANPSDIVLVAGKGHETYQEVKGVRNAFDDRAELLEAFRLRESGSQQD